MPQTSNSPQVEDGFTRIANELLAAILAFGFTQRELLVLLAIIRKTYGYGKKTDDMSASQIATMCNMGRPHVATTLVSLASRNIISKTAGRFGSVIGIQKNHRKWISQDIFKGSLASTESVQGVFDLFYRGCHPLCVHWRICWTMRLRRSTPSILHAYRAISVG